MGGPSSGPELLLLLLLAGAFNGVWGTITWTFGKPSKYSFDIYFPKVCMAILAHCQPPPYAVQPTQCTVLHTLQ
jgi:hypothetical protein